MIATVDIAAALEAWAVAEIPELLGSYNFPTAEKTQQLPDVAVEVDSADISATPPPELGNLFAIEQVLMHTWRVRLLLMVPPEPGAEASAKLAGFVDSLQASVLSDGTLGGRVPWVSKEVKGSFTPPFVKFDDGTIGRAATLELTVGEPVPNEE